MSWTAGKGQTEMAPGDPWRRVVHGQPSPFFDLWAPPIPLQSTLTQELIQTWVLPMCLDLERERLEMALASRWTQIVPPLVLRLLSERNWRARVAGAYLAAVRRLGQFEPHIAGHFLRSETPYAGQGYCLALARFATASAALVLRRYLAFYLAQTERVYDQCAAMGALAWIDRVRGTSEVDGFRAGWRRFAAEKEGLGLEAVIAQFADQVRITEELEALLGAEA